MLDTAPYLEEIPQEAKIELPTLSKTQSHEDVNINSELTDNQRKGADKLLASFSDVLSDVPGTTNLIEHKITLTTDKVVCLKPYKLPLRSKELVEKEINEMLKLGVIEPSTSAYSSPIVLVNKPDQTVRFCIDFRRLNSITVKDAEPIPYQEELIASFGPSVWFSKLDLTKGYWQIPMEVGSRKYTTFQTPLGLFQFRVMPFGLVNAPATFARKFIPKFSSLSAPNADLTKSGQPEKIHWTLDCQTTFDKILLALNSDPILIMPNFSQNASDTGLGACLLQEVDGLMHPVTYIGRKLLPREKSYAIIERECLAIVWAARDYLVGPLRSSQITLRSATYLDLLNASRIC
ncbi:reverse transcriptase [Elysia marginata]|uniref:Reverse transcriptase n=1 Tax=Elysia marginata TaxID=1093978 RepID=A0AAV4ENU9_9GAST|nr:reverse transcriptase [Elysia marginata]